jgi:hypothetical protein
VPTKTTANRSPWSKEPVKELKLESSNTGHKVRQSDEADRRRSQAQSGNSWPRP